MRETKMNRLKHGIWLLSIIMLCACHKKPEEFYAFDDFVTPNKVVTKEVKVTAPTSKIKASYGYGREPRVLSAYKKFTKTGRMARIKAHNVKTVPYTRYAQPMLTCAPLKLCVVQLERGEHINHIALGDSAHWLVATSLIGHVSDGSYQLTIKPKRFDVATDLIVTTDKRVYNVGLVSKKGEGSHILNFYYPEETLQEALFTAHRMKQKHPASHVVDASTDVQLGHLHFNYRVEGNGPAWQPLRTFDDSHKTFIQMPPIVNQIDLPVLYILNDREKALVNYRYKAPYFIVDGLFKKAVLLSGKGSKQSRVVITNQNFG